MIKKYLDELTYVIITLINFSCANLFKEGQRTYVNEYFRLLPDK
jgi:hypothetical protein